MTIALRALLRQCVLGSLAARAYVHATFLNQGAATTAESANLDVQVKGHLEHKDGAKDMVTAADIAVQEAIVTALAAPCYVAAYAPGEERPPMTIVGEEDLDDMSAAWLDERLARFGPFIEAASGCRDFAAAIALLEERVDADGIVDVDPGQVSVYIDPIDATVAFVDGCRIAPMCLIGITDGGVPVAGVITRIFTQDGPHAGAECSTCPLPLSLSLCVQGGACVVWGQDVTHELDPSSPQSDVLRATYSGSTTAQSQAALLAALEPFDARPARGGGNKIMMVAQAATKSFTRVPHPHTTCDAARESAPNADFFVSTTGLKKWDTCAPHAFLRWLGGEIYTVRRDDTSADGLGLAPLRYNDTADHKVLQAGTALIATRDAAVRETLRQRLQAARYDPTATA